MQTKSQLSAISHQQRRGENQGRNKSLFAFWLLTFGFLLLSSGCAQQMKVRFNPQPTSEELAEEVSRASLSVVPRPATGPVSAGSLWPADDRTFFYGDHKARRVGDVLTVRVSETAKASNKADTDLSRSSKNNAEILALFGLQGALERSNLTNLVDVTTDSSYAGVGSTNREGRLTASLTAVVKDVLPNGNLVVQGTRSVTINNEEQFMTLTGIVRQEDIDPDNSVFSSQIADARIAFGGVGVVADKQRSGWGTWVFDWLFPF